MKKYLLLFIAILIIDGINAQTSDSEIHRLIIGDWYCIHSPDAGCFVDPDSLYFECSFLENEFDKYKICPDLGGITPYVIRNQKLIVSHDTTQSEEGFIAVVSVIDSNTIKLKSDDELYLLRRLISDEYKLTDFMRDRLLLWQCVYRLSVPKQMMPMIGNEIDNYFRFGFVRREFQVRLERKEIDKQTVIKYIRENYIDTGELPYYLEQDFKRYILMIDDYY